MCFPERGSRPQHNVASVTRKKTESKYRGATTHKILVDLSPSCTRARYRILPSDAALPCFQIYSFLSLITGGNISTEGKTVVSKSFPKADSLDISHTPASDFSREKCVE